MTIVTLVIATLSFFVALRSRPIVALCVYCAGLLLYPQTLTIQVGTADFSVSRILILAVFATLVRRPDVWQAFRWSWTDTFMLASYLLEFVALLHTFPGVAVERHGGRFFDTMLPYFATRMIVTTDRHFVTLVRGLSIIVVPLVILGVHEMLTGHSLVSDVITHYIPEYARPGANLPLRLGLQRAVVTFTHPIAFGLVCALVAPLTLSLWNGDVWPKRLVFALVAVSCLGVFASLSSGPFVSLAFSGFVFVLVLRPRLAAALVIAGAMCVGGYASYAHRSYLNALASLTFQFDTAQYRIGVIREALEGGMTGHWWAGYGYVGVGPDVDNTHFLWQYKDTVNLYIQTLVRAGLLGLIPYVLANVAYYGRLLKAMRIAPTPRAIWLAVSLLAAVVGWNAAMMTVGALSQNLQLLYLAIALSVNMPSIVACETRSAE